MQLIDMTQRFHNRPLMISDEMVEHLQRHTLEALKIEDQSALASTMWTAVYAGERKPYRVEGNVAIIPVNGTLYHKVSWAGYSYTGYDWINNMIDFAREDGEIAGVVLDYASGGGEVDGAFECAEKIHQLTAEKPVLSLVNNHAYSAAYLLASAGSKIAVPATGGVGSVGIMTSHLDVSEAMSENGYKLTFIYKGKHKVDGNSYQPLPEPVRKRIESKMDTPYNLFVDTVARYRSMDAQAIRDTEALTYGAEEALSLGLVDSVSSPEEAIAAFVAELNGKQWGTSMTVNADVKQTTTSADKTGSENSAVVDQKTVDAARAEGVTKGATDERARIMGILNCDEAKGKTASALAMCNQGMSVDAAKAILATVPAAETTTTAAAPAANHFANAMTNTENPEMSASGGKETEKSPAMKGLEALSHMTGEKFTTQ